MTIARSLCDSYGTTLREGGTDVMMAEDLFKVIKDELEVGHESIRPKKYAAWKAHREEWCDGSDLDFREADEEYCRKNGLPVD